MEWGCAMYSAERHFSAHILGTPFGTESFVFQVAIQKFKDQDI